MLPLTARLTTLKLHTLLTMAPNSNVWRIASGTRRPARRGSPSRAGRGLKRVHLKAQKPRHLRRSVVLDPMDDGFKALVFRV